MNPALPIVFVAALTSTTDGQTTYPLEQQFVNMTECVFYMGSFVKGAIIDNVVGEVIRKIGTDEDGDVFLQFVHGKNPELVVTLACVNTTREKA